MNSRLRPRSHRRSGSREVFERQLGVPGRVQRSVEIDIERRRLPAKVGLRVARRCVWLCPVLATDGGVIDVPASGTSIASPAAASSTAASYWPPRLSVFDRRLFRMAGLEAGIALRELFVELPRVEQDQRSELHRPRGRVDLPAVTRASPAAEGARNGRDERGSAGPHRGRRVVGERDPVADRFVRAPLEHAAVDEDAGAARLEQELRPGDGRRATEKVDLHGCTW